MAETAADILEQFRRDHARDHAGDINLSLRPAYLDLLKKLGDPHLRLPPVFHVAGTNGKGSTCAFLRAMLEAAGYKVHVYTSPHLVDFRERIRISGELISETELTSILSECRALSGSGEITYFEAATAAAFCAFTSHPADYAIIEVGLGGRLDATNVIEKKLATIIALISYDHRDYLGDTLSAIAREKAGIICADTPCFSAYQPSNDVRDVLRKTVQGLRAPLSMGGEDWQFEKHGDGFRFIDRTSTFDLPAPALIGEHQFENAGLAIAALSVLSKPLPHDVIARGLRKVEWPARLQKITQGKLYSLLPQGWELWLDGGHNDSAGTALARQAKTWREHDGKPLHLIAGMLKRKTPQEFLAPLVPYIADLHTVMINSDEIESFTAEDLAAEARGMKINKVSASSAIQQALRNIIRNEIPGRILICGSLYLAGEVLLLNAQK